MDEVSSKKVADKIIEWVAISLTFLLPLFFLTSTPEFFEFNKKALLAAAVAIMVITWAVRHILAKSVRLTLTPGLIALSLLAASSLVSLFVQSPQKTQAFIGQPLLFISLLLFYLVTTTTLSSHATITRLLTALLASGSLLGLIAIIAFTGLINQLMPSLPQFMQNPTFSPTGSPLSLLLFLGPLLFISLPLSLRKNPAPLSRFLSLVSTILIAVGLGVTLFQVKDGGIILLPFRESWSIAVENFKDPTAALVGVGPEEFGNAFTAHKSVAFNLTPNWNFRFTVSRSEPLHLLTTLGLFGFAAFIWLFYVVAKAAKIGLSSRDSVDRALTLGLISTLVLELLFPTGTLSLYLLTLLLMLHAAHRKLAANTSVRDVLLRLFAVTLVKPGEAKDQPPHQEEILPWVLGAPLIIAVLVGLYLGGAKIYAAEVSFKQSLEAAAQNRGTDTYNLQIKAIARNPHDDTYRTAYALTNLALANALASREELSQTDRQNISQLIQQAIREAKIAAELDPQNTSNWETLATIYRNLIGVAEGADQWTIASLVQAIQTNPNDPRLRLQLGGIYYGVSNFDQAIRFFEQAVLLKPDWANAHYNLSAAYREKNNLEAAIEEMRLVLTYLDPAAADYAKAQQELRDLQARLGQATQPTPEASGELTAPEPLPTAAPENEQIDLPAEAGLEATESAIPEPSVSPSPSTQE